MANPSCRPRACGNAPRLRALRLGPWLVTWLQAIFLGFFGTVFLLCAVLIFSVVHLVFLSGFLVFCFLNYFEFEQN
jgi:hypothetical protein